MTIIHEAIAHGLAEELRPPGPGPLVVQRIEADDCQWRIVTQGDWPRHTGILIGCYEPGIILFDRQGYETLYHYEDPDLVEQLQAHLDRIGPP